MTDIRDEIKEKLLNEIKDSTKLIDRAELINQFEKFLCAMYTEKQVENLGKG